MTTGCPPLHVPYKDWANNQQERENWLAVERWTEMKCGGGACECFLEHRTINDFSVPLNEYSVVSVWDSTFTCGTRPASDTATTMLICNWYVNISDYTDDTTPPAPAVRFGYGVYATQNDAWMAGSHGFIEWEDGLDRGWMDNIANLPSGVEWPDALTSGSFSVPNNVAHTGPSTGFDIACVLGCWNPGVGVAGFHVETYEYSLCGCECQE